MQTQTTDGYGRTSDDGQEVFFTLPRLRKQFHDYLFQKANEIEEQKESRRYYHAVQWTRDQVKAIRERGQPVTTSNEFARKINAVVGLLERLKQDPKAQPNSPQHSDGADLGTETLRYAMNSQHWDAIQPLCSRNGAIDGIAGVEFDLESGDMGDTEVKLSNVQPDTFFYDPRSIEDDFSDALFLGTTKWVDRDVLKDMFPDKTEEIDGLSDPGSEFETGSDREIVWTNSSEQMVRAVDHWYYCKGKWKWCFHIGGVKLAEGVSPWTDEKGKTQHKFEMYSAGVDHEGDRYGFLRNLKSPCDEVNQRKSRMLHISNSRRLILKKSAVKDVEKTRKEWARADGVVVLNDNAKYGDDIFVDNQAQDFQGQLALYQQAVQELDRFGPNAAQLGQGDAGKSGRAIALLQQAGLAELGPFLIAYRNWKFRVYRKMWNGIQRFWQAERWIRVTDSEGLTQFIQLNGLTVDQYGRPALVNALGSLDVDITLDESGDVVTTMAEALETLQSAIASGMQIPPDILVDLLPIRQDVKKRLKERMEQASQPDPMAEQAKQVALEQEQAKTEETRTKVGLNKANAFKSTAQAVSTLASSGLGGGGMGGISAMGGGGGMPTTAVPARPMPRAPQIPTMSGNPGMMPIGGQPPVDPFAMPQQFMQPQPQAPMQQSFGF